MSEAIVGRGFQGRTVVITGASRGVGRRLALDFAAAGAAVVVNYWRGEEAARAVIEEIEIAGGRAIAAGGDVSEPAAVQRLRDIARASFGEVNVLVNNAGVNADRPFLELTAQDWDRVIAVNLKGAFLCTQTFGRDMVERGTGKVLNVSALTGIRERANAANYCTSKAGLNMLTKCAALELAPAVQVNGMALGYFESELVRSLYTAEQLEAVRASTPLRRMGRFEEISRLALFLCSQDADFMTGQTVTLDGGRVMH